MASTIYTMVGSGGGSFKTTSKSAIEYVSAFIGLTAVIVYGNFWFDLVHYIAGASDSSAPRSNQVTAILINASLFVALGFLAFLLALKACGGGGSSSV